MAGNANSGKHKAKLWRDALNLESNREVEGEKQITLAAKQLMLKCLAGDVSALKELGDRLDGKAPQALTGGDDDDNPIKMTHQIERLIVDPSNPNG